MLMAESTPYRAASSNPPDPSDATRLLAAYAGGERSFPRRYLVGANLRGVNLQDGNFYNADFMGADLSGADLSRANLAYANLTSANLRGANLSAAFLDHADFTNADTTGVVTDRPTPPLQPLQQPAEKPVVELEVKPSLLSMDTSFCAQCGTALRAEDKFCPRCGTARRETATPPTMDAKQSISPAQATTSASQRSPGSVQPGMRPAAASASSTVKTYVRAPANKNPNALLLLFAFIAEAWGLIYKVAIVILVIVGVVIFIQSRAPLTEHSSCQQFEQADADAQTKVLQDMMAAHHDTSSIQTARFSVNLYCNVYGPSAPIDGVYSSGGVGKQPAEALHVQVPAMASVSSSQAWHLVAAKP